MIELRELARSELIEAFIVDPPSSLSMDNVQGVNLAIDRFWLYSRRTDLSWRVEGSLASASFRSMKVIAGVRLDFSWRPHGWLEHCRAKGYPKDAHPVLIEILLRRPPDKSFFAEAPKTLGSHPIRYEHRSPCVTLSTITLGPGAKVVRMGVTTRGGPGAGVFGTLGGFLRDTVTGDIYAISCEHVFGSPGNQIFHQRPRRFLRSVDSTPIAEVRFATAPPVVSATSKCNNVTQPNAVPDLAIAELFKSTAHSSVYEKHGTVDRVTLIADMTPGDPVFFLGASSGYVQAKIGSLNIWREVQIDGKSQCVGDVFTLEPPQHWYVRPRLSRPGDSGAWIISQDNEIVAWDGMLFSGDDVQSFCCFAELVCSAYMAKYPNLVLDP